MATITSNGTGGGLASAGSSWAGGVVPVEGDKVIIAAGDTITLDGNYTWGDDNVTATIGTAAVSVSGTLKASRTVSSSLTVKGLLLTNYASHTLYFGNDADPIPDGITAHLILNKANTPAARTGLQQVAPASGAGNFIKWTFVGDLSRERGVPLASNATPSSADIVLTSAAHNWKVGDEILLMATNNAASVDECETRMVSSIAGATITLNSAPTYTHLAGSPACNVTCNVKVLSYNEVSGQLAQIATATPGALAIYATNGYYYIFRGTHFGALGTAGQNSGLNIGSGNPSTSNYGYTFQKCAAKNLITGTSWLNGTGGPQKKILLDNCVAYLNGSLQYGGGNLWSKDSYFAVGTIGQGLYRNTEHENAWITSRNTVAGANLFASQLILRNSTISGRGISIPQSDQDGFLFENCDLGATYGWTPVYGDKLYRLEGLRYSLGSAKLVNCLFDSDLATPGAAAQTALQGDTFQVDYVHKGQDVTVQERYLAAGYIYRDNSIKRNGTSSMRFEPKVVDSPVPFSFNIPAASGVPIRILGSTRRDTSTSSITVTISGAGITPVVHTHTAAVNTWQSFDLSATQTTGATAELTVTYSVEDSASTTAKAWVDGVPAYPWIVSARHYGYLFDETSPTRTVNPTVDVDEATASAYTNITLTATTVAISANKTFQQVYDYSQAWGVANQASAVPLTGVGVAGSPSLFAGGNVTTTGYTLNGSGSLNLGSHTLTATIPWAYTYTGGTFSQASTVPAFAGGQLSIGAAGTYTFALTDAIVSMTPTAPGTYDLGGGTFTGQVDLRNASGTHAITVALPSGVSYTTANNTGAAITVTTPQVYQSVTLSGVVAGSRVQIYDTTNSIELFNGTSGYSWTDSVPAAGNRAIRIRVAKVSGATAKKFIEANIGTCGTTEPSNAIAYLVSQSDDAVYNANAIDGSTVTGITFTDAATDVMNINIAAGAVNWKSIYAAWVWYAFDAVGITTDIDYIEAVDTANYVLSNLIIKNTSSPSVPLEITGGYGRDSVTGATIDLVDTTGGTLIFAPDHVVSYAVGSGVTAQDITDIAAASASSSAAAIAAAQTTPIHADMRKTVGTELHGNGTEPDKFRSILVP